MHTVDAHEVVLRFSALERLVHWAYCAAYALALATAGLMIVSPFARSVAVGPTRVIPLAHFVGGALLILIVLYPLVRYPVAATMGWNVAPEAMESARMSRAMISLRRAIASAGLQRFNVGQRINIVFTVATFSILAATGVAIGAGRAVPYWLQEWAYEVHVLAAIASTVVAVAHVAMAIAHPTAIRGMIGGTVPRAWAARRHRRWLADLEANSPPRSTLR